jgi:SPP1 gp7 family putative phage head morphogenesis protein
MSQALSNMIETQRRLNRNARKKPRQPGVALYPLGIEREYYRYIKSLVDFTREQIRIRLLPQLNYIETNVQSPRPTTDAWGHDVGRIVDAIRAEIARRFGTASISAIAKGVAELVSEHNKKQLKAQMNRALGIDIFLQEPYLIPEIESYAFWNTRLIQSIPEQYLDQVQNIALSGFQTGESTKSIRDKIEARYQVSKSRAQLIARDQISKLNGELTQLRQTELGIKKYRWITAGDERVRDEHRQRDGKVFSWDDPPHDGHPGQPINCRCVAQPILFEDEE